MRKSVMAGIFAYALFFVAPKAAAETASPEYLYTVSIASIKPALIAVSEAQSTQGAVVSDAQGVVNTQQVDLQPEVQTYTVESGDTLIKIARNFDTTWQRIFYKNTSIVDPDTIKPGDVLTIPAADEQLTEREIPVSSLPVEEPVLAISKPVVKQKIAAQPSVTVTRGSSDGNRYSYGYCTWYVKNMRPDLPNNLGDAINWVARARAQGMATGGTPQVGAVGQSGNHVVYVESVNDDGTVTISEMNHVGWNKTSRRTLPVDYFTYIY